jgi:chromosome segregation protein
LDLVIRKKFDKEFKVIADKFQEYFKILFNGGTAKISKVMDASELEAGSSTSTKQADDMNEMTNITDLKKIKFLQKHNATGLAGIEIKANPPGKKITSVAMLSGGERALTSIALICAIISSNPSPFVVS